MIGARDNVVKHRRQTRSRKRFKVRDSLALVIDRLAKYKSQYEKGSEHQRTKVYDVVSESVREESAWT
jgi:hypothetical protein